MAKPVGQLNDFGWLEKPRLHIEYRLEHGVCKKVCAGQDRNWRDDAATDKAKEPLRADLGTDMRTDTVRHTTAGAAAAAAAVAPEAVTNMQPHTKGGTQQQN